jgi:hypothetical protein
MVLCLAAHITTKIQDGISKLIIRLEDAMVRKPW